MIIIFPKLTEIKKIRERVGWSQTKLANKIGKSQSLIPKYEAGKQIPSYEIATMIFEVLLEEDLRIDTEVSEIMTGNIVKLKSTATVSEARDLMSKYSISQLPVVRGELVIGSVNERMWLDLLETYHNFSSLKNEIVENVMGEAIPMVPKSAKVKEISSLLRHYGSIVVVDSGKIVGIVSTADLLDIEY